MALDVWQEGEMTMRGDTRRAGRFSAIVLATLLLFGLVKAGWLPAVPVEEGAWIYWLAYLGAAIGLGLAGYEGWRLIK
jgi:hypothetical protein